MRILLVNPSSGTLTIGLKFSAKGDAPVLLAGLVGQAGGGQGLNILRL